MRSLTVVPLQRRVTAVVLSAALAVGAVFPPVGLAFVAEGDQEQEGTAESGAPAAPDSTADPDFDPGGEDVLPFDVGVPADDGDEGAPVEAEPVEDPDALAVPRDEPEDGAADPATPPLADAAPAPPPAAPAPVPAPPAVEVAPQPLAPQDATPTEPARGRDRAASHRQRDRAKRRSARSRSAPRTIVVTPAPAAEPAATPIAAPAAPEPTTTAAEATTAPRIARGSRTYTVQAGDCLWTIAAALIGDELDGLSEANRNARMQARVDRVYSLNADRIGPDPSMVSTGTVLRLR
jgi:hypothetical protein